MNENKYKPIIESAKKEQSAKGQCKWIIAMFEILTLNDLPHIEQGIIGVKGHVDRSNRKIMLFLLVVLAVVLTTNPQVTNFIGRIFAFVF